MNHLMRKYISSGIVVDSDQLDSKHDSVRIREQSSDWRAGDRSRLINIRKLTSWLVSDWQHKRRHMSLPELPFGPVRCGLFYSLRLGGVWTAADWWLQYFQVDESFSILRLENLAVDFNRVLLQHLPPFTDELHEPPRVNSKPENLIFDEPLFTGADTLRIYQNNPIWAKLEQSLYV